MGENQISTLAPCSHSVVYQLHRGRSQSTSLEVASGVNMKNNSVRIVPTYLFFHLLLQRQGGTKWEQGQFVFLFLVIFYQHYDKRDDWCHLWSRNCLPFRVLHIFLFDSCDSIFSFLCNFVCSFLSIDGSVLRYTASGYPFVFFKLFFIV